MKYVELAPGINSSALGFGCAPILGSVDASAARRALAEALDVGVTHFDLARSYGYGQAEAFVGGFLKSQRNRVTIVTKFGIRATPLAGVLAPLKPLARRIRNLAQTGGAGSSDRLGAEVHSEKLVPKQGGASVLADLLHRRIPITPVSMSRSLEKSLRSLGSDYVDLLLVHEPLASVAEIESILECAEHFVAIGKIRAFGIAYTEDQESLHSGYLSRFQVRQTNIPHGDAEYNKLVRERSGAGNIFFSPFRGMSTARSPEASLIKIAADFPRSVTLCSMFNPRHIRLNAAVYA
jgi:aryl-alcohol dehydrogenase-like predicted oxidoreductase